MGEGSITYKEFLSLIEDFVDKSLTLKDNWSLQHSFHGCVYMRKKTQQARTEKSIIKTAISTKPNNSHQLAGTEATLSGSETQTTGFLSDMEMELEVDGVCMPESSGRSPQPLTYEYHVVYSESYSVPVLYFNIFKPDGRRLMLEEVWKLCPPSTQPYLTHNKWSTITQQEHPLLGKPYLQVHPCHTPELMAHLASGHRNFKQKNYLVGWLSTVAPLAGLQISPEYVT